jgi:putative transposase
MTNQFFLIVPIEKSCKSNNINQYVSIDPGIRTFLTCYSNNKVDHIASNCSDKIKKYINQIDKINNSKYINNEKLKEKIINKRNNKIQNLVADMHWKTALYLCKNYGTIYLGEMSTQSIVENTKSNINKMTKRVLHGLSHYKFRERLKAKCEEYNVKLELVNERYTSKMCCHCGYIDHKLGGNKEYKCKNKYCSLKIERDINGAINILKRGLKIIE